MKYDKLIKFDEFEIAIFEGILKDIENQINKDTFRIELGSKLFHYFIFYRCENICGKIAECRSIEECDYRLFTIDEYFNHR
jgi:hypothetical protein